MTDEFELAVKSYGKRQGGQPNPKFIKYISSRPALLAIYDELPGTSWAEKLYLLENPHIQIPRCSRCGAKIPFNSYSQGYYTYCTDKHCRSSNADLREKIKTGMKRKIDYEARKLKTQTTNIARYGVSNPMQNEEIVTRLKNRRHGKERERLVQRLSLWDIELLDKDYTTANERRLYNFKCKKCSTVFQDYLDATRTPRCPSCRPLSLPEEEIRRWLVSLGVSVIKPGKTLIPPKEIDLYLPEHNVALELNGAYWHAEMSSGRGPDYHLSKTKACEALGIRLIHILDIDWETKRDIVKSIVMSAIGFYEKVYYARKLKLSYKKNSKFFEDNHIAGSRPATFQISLVDDNDTIIASASFAKSRYSIEAPYELIRYAVKLNCKVIGGFSRLLAHSWDKLNTKTIIAYSDRSMFTGNVYRRFGIELDPTAPGYSYFSAKDYKLYSRQSFQKHMLKEKLAIYDEKLSEWENMKANGYDRLWNCGNWKFLLKKPLIKYENLFS